MDRWNDTDNMVLVASPWKVNALVRSCNVSYGIRRSKFVLLYKKTSFHARWQEACSLPNEYSAKILSSNQNGNLWFSFYKDLFPRVWGVEGSPQKGCGSLLLPHKCLQFSSASLNRGNAQAGKVCLCVTVCKMLETGFCICIVPLLKH